MITIAELSELAHELVAADRRAEEAKKELSARVEAARILREESLPMAMLELGLNQVQLDTGEKVSVTQDMRCGIPADRREEAYAWLDAHGFGGLIKTEVVTYFTRGELEAARSLAARLQEEGLQPEVEQGVHWQTLRAFLREQMEQANADLPLELFGAQPVWVAKVTTK